MFLLLIFRPAAVEASCGSSVLKTVIPETLMYYSKSKAIFVGKIIEERPAVKKEDVPWKPRTYVFQVGKVWMGDLPSIIERKSANKTVGKDYLVYISPQSNFTGSDCTPSGGIRSLENVGWEEWASIYILTILPKFVWQAVWLSFVPLLFILFLRRMYRAIFLKYGVPQKSWQGGCYTIVALMFSGLVFGVLFFILVGLARMGGAYNYAPMFLNPVLILIITLLPLFVLYIFIREMYRYIQQRKEN